MTDSSDPVAAVTGDARVVPDFSNSAGRKGKHSSHHCTGHLPNFGPLDPLTRGHAVTSCPML
jgi:hypothetical protein